MNPCLNWVIVYVVIVIISRFGVKINCVYLDLIFILGHMEIPLSLNLKIPIFLSYVGILLCRMS